MMTPFSKKCEILANLWIQYRTQEGLKDFFEYNDMGLPLAYAINNEIVGNTAKSQGVIEETWELFLAALNLQDIGFNDVAQMFEAAQDKD